MKFVSIVLSLCGVLCGCAEPFEVVDADGDGSGVCLPADASSCLTYPSDCNDEDASVYPGALEKCEDNIDQDCDGTDLPYTYYYYDGDGDRYGDAPFPACLEAQPAGYITQGGDCDDYNPIVHPGAYDQDGDGIDQDCDGVDGTRGLTLDHDIE